MKITQIRESRENGDTEALSVMDINLLIEKMKKETKLRPVSGLREALHFVLPGEPCSAAHKLPRIIPAAVFGRVNGVKKMKTYNGIVELTVGPLAGKAEIALVKRKAAELPQTILLVRAIKASKSGLASPVRTVSYPRQRKKLKYFRRTLTDSPLNVISRKSPSTFC